MRRKIISRNFAGNIIIILSVLTMIAYFLMGTLIPNFNDVERGFMIALGMIVATVILTEGIKRAYTLKKEHSDKRGGLRKRIVTFLYHWEEEIIRPTALNNLITEIRQYLQDEVIYTERYFIKEMKEIKTLYNQIVKIDISSGIVKSNFRKKGSDRFNPEEFEEFVNQCEKVNFLLE